LRMMRPIGTLAATMLPVDINDPKVERWLRKLSVGATLGILLIAAPSRAEQVGAVRICRQTDLPEPAQSRIDNMHVRLPALLWLQDWGIIGDPASADHHWPLSIVTLRPVELPPSVKCATVPARISPDSRVKTVSPRDRRYLEIEGIAKPDGRFDRDPDEHASEAFGDDATTAVEIEIVRKMVR
jgi:hypothetical protein